VTEKKKGKREKAIHREIERQPEIERER